MGLTAPLGMVKARSSTVLAAKEAEVDAPNAIGQPFVVAVGVTVEVKVKVTVAVEVEVAVRVTVAVLVEVAVCEKVTVEVLVAE
jgi:hypothetical protein